MEAELIKIKCPNCSAILGIKNTPGLENKSVPCPICKKTSLYKDFKKVHQPAADSETQWTEKPSAQQSLIGRLQLAGTSYIYPLSQGVNTIGRKAKTSLATLQIDTVDRTVSRMHAVIEVRKTGKGYMHYFSNGQNKNDTYINSQLVAQGDSIILSGGETIRLADIVLRFTLAEEEDTLY